MLSCFLHIITSCSQKPFYTTIVAIFLLYIAWRLTQVQKTKPKERKEKNIDEKRRYLFHGKRSLFPQELENCLYALSISRIFLLHFHSHFLLTVDLRERAVLGWVRNSRERFVMRFHLFVKRLLLRRRWEGLRRLEQRFSCALFLLFPFNIF